MRIQFKYTFLAGLHIRGAVFLAAALLMFTFVGLGLLGYLPLAANIAAVSLGGTALAAVVVANVVSDVAIIRRMFGTGAYMYALTPAPRWKILTASVVSMLLMDLISMAVLIAGQVWLALNLVGDGFAGVVAELARSQGLSVLHVVLAALTIPAPYLLIMSIILFAITAKKSILANLPASGLLAVLTAIACLCVLNLLHLLLIPFSTVDVWGVFISISVNGTAGLLVYALLMFLQAMVLFVLTSKLMERKMNV